MSQHPNPTRQTPPVDSAQSQPAGSNEHPDIAMQQPVGYFVSNVSRGEGNHDNLPDALDELAILRADLPGEDWRVYAITEITTERPSDA